MPRNSPQNTGFDMILPFRNSLLCAGLPEAARVYHLAKKLAAISISRLRADRGDRLSWIDLDAKYRALALYNFQCGVQSSAETHPVGSMFA